MELNIGGVTEPLRVIVSAPQNPSRPTGEQIYQSNDTPYWYPSTYADGE